MSFSAFNLLMGVSGVGKTRILQALQLVRFAGLSDARIVNGCSWTLELEVEGMKFLWSQSQHSKLLPLTRNSFC